MTTYLQVENSEGLFNLLNQFRGDELSVKKDVGGAMALIDPDNGDIVAYVSDGVLEEKPVPDKFQNDAGEVDRPQLMDDLEQYLDVGDDRSMLEGMKKEIDARIGGDE